MAGNYSEHVEKKRDGGGKVASSNHESYEKKRQYQPPVGIAIAIAIGATLQLGR